MQTELFKVTGMTCGSCASAVTHALKGLAGVSEAEVTLGTGQTAVRFDERVTSAEKLKSAVKGAGYGVGAAGPVQPRAKGCCCA